MMAGRGGVGEAVAVPSSMQTHQCGGPLWDQSLAEGVGVTAEGGACGATVPTDAEVPMEAQGASKDAGADGCQPPPPRGPAPRDAAAWLGAGSTHVTSPKVNANGRADPHRAAAGVTPGTARPAARAEQPQGGQGEGDARGPTGGFPSPPSSPPRDPRQAGSLVPSQSCCSSTKRRLRLRRPAAPLGSRPRGSAPGQPSVSQPGLHIRGRARQRSRWEGWINSSGRGRLLLKGHRFLRAAVNLPASIPPPPRRPQSRQLLLTPAPAAPADPSPSAGG